MASGVNQQTRYFGGRSAMIWCKGKGRTAARTDGESPSSKNGGGAHPRRDDRARRCIWRFARGGEGGGFPCRLIAILSQFRQREPVVLILGNRMAENGDRFPTFWFWGSR